MHLLSRSTHRIRYRALAAILALSTVWGFSGTTVPAAQAHPDGDKLVATQAHVDSPHTMWDSTKQNFYLISKFGDGRRIENTVNWVGKGYTSSWLGFGSNYTYRVTDKPGYSFLGKPGQALYRAPANPGSPYEPIWIGMGANSDIPVEEFRDQSVVLDLLDFKGPGRMEMWTSGYHGPNRMLSSHDTALRSYWMEAGTHTHNETTFTKPGRYEFTYRAIARHKDGHIIKSAPPPKQCHGKLVEHAPQQTQSKTSMLPTHRQIARPAPRQEHLLSQWIRSAPTK